MPVVGTRAADSLATNAPIIELMDLKVEPLVAPRVEVFHSYIEVDDRVLKALLPAALCLTLPPMVAIVFYVCEDSSIGPFKLAQLRVNARMVVRSRGLLLASYVEADPEVADRLRQHWGFDCRPGQVEIHARYDAVEGRVAVDDRTILRIAGADPTVMSPQDIIDMSNFNPIRLRPPARSDGSAPGSRTEPEPRLLQVDAEFLANEGATRSIRVELKEFDESAWNAPGLTQEGSVRSVHYQCEFRLPPPRYMADPALPMDQESEIISNLLRDYPPS